MWTFSHFSVPLSPLFLCLPTPASVGPCGRINAEFKGWWYSFFSSFSLSGQSTAIILRAWRPTPFQSKLWAGCWSYGECIIKTPAHWHMVQCLCSACWEFTRSITTLLTGGDTHSCSPWALDTVRSKKWVKHSGAQASIQYIIFLLILSDVSKLEGKKECVVKTKGLRLHQAACISNHTSRQKVCFIQYQ